MSYSNEPFSYKFLNGLVLTINLLIDSYIDGVAEHNEIVQLEK